MDECLYNPNVTAGIIAHTLDDSQSIFEDKVKFAYENLDPHLKAAFPLVSDSAKELAFAHGSRIRVGTSMRGQSLQYLHISEFGKICAKYPEKAKEIITGSLNSVQAGQHIFIESTAEGTGGYFYEMCQQAQKMERDKLHLTELDYKFFFFPWWKDPSYKLSSGYVEPESTIMDSLKVQFPRSSLPGISPLEEYFRELEAKDIYLSGSQKAWYSKKYQTQEEDMKREYPSTPEESFQSSASGLYYGKHLTNARLEKRISNVPYDDAALVHTACDLGYNDNFAIWWFQICGKEIHLIDFHQDSGRSLADYINLIKSKPYTYGDHLAPHDIKVHELSSGFSRLTFAAELGIRFRVAPKLSKQEGIDAVRGMFPKCWFDKTKCSVGIQMLENYRKVWDVRLGRWSDEPLHDYSSDAADAFRTLAVGLPHITGQKSNYSDTLKAINSYFGN